MEGVSTEVSFNYITFAQAKEQLLQRLNDQTAGVYVNNSYTDAELALYFTEALRTWNALTSTWVTDWAFTITPPVSSVWYNLRGVSGYARQQTVLDSDIYTLIEYHFLEPPTGATWTGTSQFSINDLASALERRRDEIIQISACNPVNIPLASTPNTRRTVLPDNVLEVIRARFVPASGSPNTLFRDDALGMKFFSPGYLQNQAGSGQSPAGLPQSYAQITGPPLALDVDYAPNVVGSYDLLALRSGLTFAPPASTLLGIPNDWSWVAKWGAMADLLSSGSEKQDSLRAQYCLQRYKDGLTLIAKSAWLYTAQLNGVAADVVAAAEMDAYTPEWDTSGNAAPPAVVMGGLDFVAVSPMPPANPVSVLLTVVGNAPIPGSGTDYVQASRDTLDVILDYAQHIATFKKGGQEFEQTFPLAQNFATAAMATNERLKNLGIFRDLLLLQGQKQSIQQERIEEVEA